MPPTNGTMTWMKRENRRLAARVAELEATVRRLTEALKAGKTDEERRAAWELGRDVPEVLASIEE